MTTPRVSGGRISPVGPARPPRAIRHAVAGLCLSWLVVTAACGDELAQEPALTPGMRVRITAAGITGTAVAGTICALDEQDIILEVPGRTEHLSVSRDRISRLELSGGRQSRLIGALIGAVLGGAIGALTGKAATTNQPYSLESVNEAGGAIAGALVGSTVGALLPPGERWNEIAVSRYRVSVAPRLDRAVGATVALAF